MNVVDNELITAADLAANRYVLTLDPETGEEIRVELLDEFSQEDDDCEINAFASASALEEAEAFGTVH